MEVLRFVDAVRSRCAGAPALISSGGNDDGLLLKADEANGDWLLITWEGSAPWHASYATRERVRRKAMHCPHVAKWKTGTKVAQGGTAAEKRADP